MNTHRILTALLVSALLSAGVLSFAAHASGPEGTSQIDINKASVEELLQLPRIGQKMAERIVQYRQEHGPFKSVDDLTAVKGIGEKVLDQLRPSIKVTTK